MHFCKCSKSNGLFQGFPGGKAITIWPLLSSLFSKSLYLRASGADSWKSSILHPGQNDLSFRILLAHNGATSAWGWQAQCSLNPTPAGGERFFGEKRLLLFLHGPGAQREENGEGKGGESGREKSESGQANVLRQPK